MQSPLFHSRLFGSPVFRAMPLGFSPLDIAGLQLWLDASQITGLNDGDAVASWADASGNGWTATQSTANARPLYRTNALNGLPVVRFDGTNDVIVNTSFSRASPFTVFAVVTKNEQARSGSGSILSGTNAPPAVYFGDGNTATERAAIWSGFTASVSVYTPAPNNASMILTAVFNGTSSSLQRDNETPALGTTQVSNTLTGYRIGAPRIGVAGYWLRGDIAELLIYSGFLSADNRSTVKAYLNRKWDIY